MIVPCTLEHLLYIVANCREQDARAITAVRWDDDLEAWARERMQVGGPAYALMDGGVPVAAGGIALPRPGVFWAWLVATPGWKTRWRTVVKAAKKGLQSLFEMEGIHRIEAQCLADFPEAAALLTWLGFRREGIHPGWGKRGETFMTWSKLKEV